MPLSEHEQRQLDAIERALYADDPKFSRAVRYTDPKVHGRRRIVSGAAFVGLGLAVLVTGAILSLWYVGVAGFLVMVVGATRAYAGVRRMAVGRAVPSGHPAAPTGEAKVVPLPSRRPWVRRPRDPRGPRRAAGPRSFRAWRAGIVERFEERWRRRFDGD